MKQDRNKLSTISQSTYKTIKVSTSYLNEVKETTKQSINETLRQSFKSSENWLSRIAELTREINDKTAVDILTVVCEVCYLFWLDNIENINEARMLIGKIYQKEIPSLEKGNSKNSGTKNKNHLIMKTSYKLVPSALIIKKHNTKKIVFTIKNKQDHCQ